MKFAFTLVTTVLLSFSAQAWDLFNFKSMGFSADGSRYAFVESVLADGSGFGIARVTVINVLTNTVLVSHEVVLKEEDATEEQALQKVLEEVDLRSYNIADNNLGQTLLSRETTDRSNYTNTAFTTGWMRTYNLIVEGTSVPSSTCESDPELLKLTITSDDDPSAPMSKVIYEDTTLGERRECSHGYQVAHVIRNGKNLVIILTVRSRGFEGSDVNFFAVGKEIDFE